jgi:hypothetical protein
MESSPLLASLILRSCSLASGSYNNQSNKSWKISKRLPNLVTGRTLTLRLGPAT